jgi:hypothetical protein
VEQRSYELSVPYVYVPGTHVTHANVPYLSERFRFR